MNIKKYENQICNINIELLKDDEYCFFVLSRILQGECRLTLTDNNRIIICHSCDPYPVWVWLPDSASKDEMEFAYQTLKANFELDGRYRFNLKYNLANFIINRAEEDGCKMRISTNMLAYNCPSPNAPKKTTQGTCKAATFEDVEIVADFMNQFHEDVGIDQSNIDTHRKKARELIADQRLYFWYDENGEKVAMTSYGISGDKGSIGNVFTRHDKRRCGYAANLVYAVTLIIRDKGKMPTLYTDADYAASNACYEGIGYKKQGSLCTII